MLTRKLEPEVMDDASEAQAYDAMDHSVVNTAFADRLLSLRPHGPMLDLGTGPGHIPLLICDRLADVKITAVDLAESMLAMARIKLAGSPHAGRIVFERADINQLPYPDAAFATVFSNTVMHHLADPAAFLREARRVLRPGGVVLIRDLFRPDSEARLAELVEKHAADCDARQRMLFADSLRAALTPEELHQAAERARWKDFQISVDSDRHMSLWKRGPE